LSKYASFNTRICRPIGLFEKECRKVIAFMVDRIGLQYDMRNMVDQLRYRRRFRPWRARSSGIGVQRVRRQEILHIKHHSLSALGRDR